MIVFPHDKSKVGKFPTIVDRSPYGYGDLEWYLRISFNIMTFNAITFFLNNPGLLTYSCHSDLSLWDKVCNPTSVLFCGDKDIIRHARHGEV